MSTPYRTPNCQKRILAIDYGERRLGIAVSDPTNTIAQGQPTIVYRRADEAVKTIRALIEKYQAGEIVIGMPLNAKGEKAHAALQVEKFIKMLSQKVRIPITTWDERFTSVSAERALREMGKAPSKHKDKIDRIAATLLLQNYLDK